MSTLNALLQAIEDVLDYLFSHTFEIAQIRLLLFVFAAIMTWIGMAFWMHPWAEWKLVISWMLNLIPPPVEINPYSLFISDLASRFFAVDVLARWVILITPFIVAMQAASAYLSDIFELSEEKTASQYISQAAFAFPENYYVIHIRDGAVAPEDEKSPIMQIGGPGVVEVSLENVAVFERFQDTWEIIGPENSYKRLDEFERLRDVIDLREHHQELEIEGRTRDGIPVSIQNMRILFHVLRNESLTSDDTARYTYDPESVKKLVFNEPLPEGKRVPWFNAIKTLLRDELERFISEHTLSEILASAVEPGQNVTPSGLLAFIPRMELSNSLFDLRGEFVKRARERGLWLEWVDVGIWQVSGDLLTQQHIEAWKISRENQFKSSNWNLSKLKEQTRLRELQSMTGELPVLSFARLSARQHARDETIQVLLQEYSGVLKSADLELSKVEPAMKLSSKAALRRRIQKTLEWIRVYLRKKNDPSNFSGSARPQPPPVNPGSTPPRPSPEAGPVSQPTGQYPPGESGTGSPAQNSNSPGMAQTPPSEPPRQDAVKPVNEQRKPSISPSAQKPDTPPAISRPGQQNQPVSPTRKPPTISPGTVYSPKEAGSRLSPIPGKPGTETSETNISAPESTSPPSGPTEPEYIPLEDLDMNDTEESIS